MRRLKLRICRKDFIYIGRGFSHDRGVLINISQDKTERAALPLPEQVSGTS